MVREIGKEIEGKGEIVKKIIERFIVERKEGMVSKKIKKIRGRDFKSDMECIVVKRIKEKMVKRNF